MSPEKTIKLQARAKLADNNWPSAVGVVLTLAAAAMAVYYLIASVDLALNTALGAFVESLDIESLLPNSVMDMLFGGEVPEFEISVALYLLIPSALLLMPMILGAVRYFYLLAKDTDTEYKELFYYYGGGRMFRAIGRFLGVGVRCLWQAALCFLPGYLLLTNTISYTYDLENLDFSDILCYFISYALLLGGILLFTRLTSKYFLAFYLYVEDESLTVRELCDRSVLYTERFKDSIMKLTLSMFPLMLSCILIFPALFVVPYVFTAKATSAKWIIALYNNSQAKDE